MEQSVTSKVVDALHFCSIDVVHWSGGRMDIIGGTT